LRDLGWIEGRNIAIEYRWAEGRSERFAEIVAEYVGRKVDLIFTNTYFAAQVAMQAAPSIPIIFITADPLGVGLVKSLTRPGGNATGFSLQGTDTTGKRIELLREGIPSLRNLAVLAPRANPAVALEIAEIDAAGRALGVQML